jgi:hypothetical protein
LINVVLIKRRLLVIKSQSSTGRWKGVKSLEVGFYTFCSFILFLLTGKIKGLIHQKNDPNGCCVLIQFFFLNLLLLLFVFGKL